MRRPIAQFLDDYDHFEETYVNKLKDTRGSFWEAGEALIVFFKNGGEEASKHIGFNYVTCNRGTSFVFQGPITRFIFKLH